MTAEKVAELIADRINDPVRLSGAVAAMARQSRYADVLPWRPASLSGGSAGLAVVCAALDVHRPGDGWDRAGHQHLATAVAASSPYDVSLFSGLAGIGLAATLLAGGRPRYERLLSSLDAAVGPAVISAARQLRVADGCAASDHDLISGLTGTGAYLLARPRGDALTAALTALTRLLAGTGHPRSWHTPADMTVGTLRDYFPDGHHNCGIAHGVPGPLALLALAILDGAEVPGARDAIEATATWLADHRVGTADAPDWPDAVALDDPGPARSATAEPGRAAWCYGSIGVARSLWLAGTALGRSEWRDLAARTIRAVAARPPERWWLTTSGLCHGRAGLLRVLQRFAADLDDPALAATAETLAARLAAEYDPDTLLGMRVAEPGGVLVDHPGLLDGVPGVALALLGPAPGPSWDRMLLLS
ncbi:lanthionine synthetase C family protein [Actinoplanes sp. NPDC051861]|uniref:lanthionine synthetase C family protein n=1 Tax=Actinoplanes sp. NPDC051861 TaxID=3155170 RepID=UPI0034446D11